MKPGLAPSILREYDIRGIIDETLTAEDAELVGRSLGSISIRSGGTLACVGYDGRYSSPVLETALIRGLTACGMRVIRTGLGPTPMLYFAQREIGADLAIMVTGSHNPANFNGFKILMNGKPFFGSSFAEMNKVAETAYFESGRGTVSDRDFLGKYLDRITADWDGGSTALRIIWDAGNGAAGPAIEQLSTRLPGKHSLLFCDVDGSFPNHHPNPTDPETLSTLVCAVRETGADIGIAVDGDGDRIGVVDDTGRILWGDQILQIVAADVLAKNPGATVIADVKASQSLFDEIARLGGIPVMWRTGHSLIKSKMAETSAKLAGEMSGHIFFADRYYGFDDALYAAVRLLGIIARNGKRLSDCVDRLPKVHNSPELRFYCPDDKKFGVVESLRLRLSEENCSMICIDGVRVLRRNGWWLLRASNTEPALVARVEARSGEELVSLQVELAQYLTAVCQSFGLNAAATRLLPMSRGGHGPY